MYFKDLTPYTYAGSRGELNVGWLDTSESYNKAPIPVEFVFALQRFKKDDAITKRTKGFHMCPFCTSASSSSEIRAFSKDGSSYAAPYMIFHYDDFLRDKDVAYSAGGNFRIIKGVSKRNAVKELWIALGIVVGIVVLAFTLGIYLQIIIKP